MDAASKAFTGKPATKRWRNPYIALVESLPEQIVGLSPHGLSDEEHSLIKERVRGYANVYIELCSVSGNHLLTLAKQDPSALFAGFELRYKRAFRTAEKALQAGVTNVLVCKTKAEDVAKYFEPGSVAGVYINFPDPWSDKRRWSKHRLLKPAYLEAVASLLRPGGFFAYKTDHRGCFEEVLTSLQCQQTLAVNDVSLDLHHSPYAEANVLSEFEHLFVSQGLPIHYLRAHKN